MSYDYNSYNYAEVHKPKKKRYGGLITALLLLALIILAFLVATSAYLILDATGRLPDEMRFENVFTQPTTSAVVEPAQNIPLEEEISLNFEAVTEGQLTTESLYDLVAPQTVGIRTYSGDTPITSGSGIVLSEEGHIVTNDHVVSGGNSFMVTMSDGEVYSASFVGGDASSDLAVLKLNEVPQGLSAASFAQNDELSTGEKVVVIGSPGGLSASITEGIISGPTRPKHYISGNQSDEVFSLIQTTAAINPGNSGGALVNAQGQVVGIVSSKIANVNYEGIGFAIPTFEALPIIEQLLLSGSVPGKAKLGIEVIPVNALDIEILGYENVGGLLLINVELYSDLINYGVTPNDIIIRADGIDLIENNHLTDLIATKEVGDTIDLEIWKASTGKVMQITAVLVDSNSMAG